MMDAITRDEIAAVEQELHSFTESDIRKLMKRYQKKQTALLVYTAAVAEREQLNEEEYDVLISSTLLTWQTFEKKCSALKKVPIERMEELDNRMFEDLQSKTNQTDETIQQFVQEMVSGHAQPNLMARLLELSMRPESPIREEMKEIIFLAAKNVLDALVEAC